jgi:DNA gyrase subunit A
LVITTFRLHPSPFILSMRPDLSALDPAVREYIEALEAEIQQLKNAPVVSVSSTDDDEAADPTPLEFNEPPTTWSIIALTTQGFAKRTYRHLYTRQRRGGIGIFDIEVGDEDRPTQLAHADETHTLIVVSNMAKAYRLAVNEIPATPIRSRGIDLAAHLHMLEHEKPALIFAEPTQGGIALLSRLGFARLWPYYVFGPNLKQGMTLYKWEDFGTPTAWGTTYGEDVFIATRSGLGIRFAEKTLPPQGGAGIRIETGDAAVAITGVRADSQVLLLSHEGKGTLRLMSGFSANKAPGSGGKVALKADKLTNAMTIAPNADLLIISRNSKIIRFNSAEIPAKEGVVQGVNCMTLRGDEPMAVTSVNP